MSKQKTLVPIDAPKPGEEFIQTKEIDDIQVMKFRRQKRDFKPYKIKTRDGGQHWLKKVSQNPKHLIFVNHKPVATCSVNYTPVAHSRLKDTCLETLSQLKLKPLDIEIRIPKTYQWVMTVTLERDYKLPIGHLRQFENFDWGIALTNSYDLSMGINAMIYVYRQICSNGLYGYDPIDRKRFIHIERERDQAVIRERVRSCIEDTVNHVKDYFKILEEMSQRTPTREQMALIFNRLNIRKTESVWLKDFGVEIEWDKSDIDTVNLDGDLANTEYDLLNAITSISGRVEQVSRMFELQFGIMETIQRARNG